MGQVAIAVNGRSYRFECGDGEEARLQELAAYVKSRMDGLTREHGTIGEDRLLLMTALLIADELWDATAGDIPAAKVADAAGAKRRA
jgi:cell division protein ZapA